MGGDNERTGSAFDKGCERRINVRPVTRFQDEGLPSERAAASMSFVIAAEPNTRGSVRYAIVVAEGAISRNSPSRLPVSSEERVVTPVILPLGRFRLATSPHLIGSLAIEKTIGIVEVAFFAAKIVGAESSATITATWRWTSSAASGASSTCWWFAQRYS